MNIKFIIIIECSKRKVNKEADTNMPSVLKDTWK